MKVIDANVLPYLINHDATQHSPVSDWWESAVEQDEPLGFSWFSLVAFYRIATHAHAFHAPLSPAQAARVIEGWLSLDQARVVSEAIG